MNKIQTLAQAVDGRGCLGQSADDEPVFVLTARDPLAASLVRRWVMEYQDRHIALNTLSLNRQAKANEAGRVADEMDAWREAHK